MVQDGSSKYPQAARSTILATHKTDSGAHWGVGWLKKKAKESNENCTPRRGPFLRK